MTKKWQRSEKEVTGTNETAALALVISYELIVINQTDKTNFIYTSCGGKPPPLRGPRSKRVDNPFARRREGVFASVVFKNEFGALSQSTEPTTNTTS